MKRRTRKERLPDWVIVSRDQISLSVRRDLGPASSIIRDNVDFGLRVANRICEIGLADRPTVSAHVGLILWHKQLSLLDALDALLSTGSTQAAPLIARTILEVASSQVYILEQPDERVAMSYWVRTESNGVHTLETLARDHAPGSGPTIAAKRAREQLRKTIAEGGLQKSAQRELENMGMDLPWYAAFGGPRSIHALVKRTGSSDLMVVVDKMYPVWSGAVHGTDGSSLIVRDKVGFKPLRNADLLQWANTATVMQIVFRASLRAIGNHFGDGLLAGAAEWHELTDPKIYELHRRVAEAREESVESSLNEGSG